MIVVAGVEEVVGRAVVVGIGIPVKSWSTPRIAGNVRGEDGHSQ